MTAAVVMDLVDASGSEPRFIGSRCEHCGDLAFPPRRRCSNCGRTDFTAGLVEAVGIVYSFSIVHFAKPGVEVPYALAVADFPSDIRVFARVVGWMGRLEIGARVTAALPPDAERTGTPAADYRLRIVEGPMA